MKVIIEGLLFLKGSDGLTFYEMKEILKCENDDELKKCIKELYKEYINDDNRGIQLELLGDKFKLTTKAEHKDYYKELVAEEEDSTLTQASLETLAIIAYNEPITRIEIDEIRGVNSSYLIRKLMIKDLIQEVGRAETAGRPRQYGVTNSFLDYFGLNSIEDLPKIKEPQAEVKDEETNLFESRYKEEV